MTVIKHWANAMTGTYLQKYKNHGIYIFKPCPISKKIWTDQKFEQNLKINQMFDALTSNCALSKKTDVSSGGASPGKLWNC